MTTLNIIDDFDYICPPMLLCDVYKLAHPDQYPDGTEFVYSNFTPRSSYIEGIDEVVVFGIQAFVKRYLINYFNKYFFSRPKAEVIAEYVRYLRFSLGVQNPNTTRIEYLHDLQKLPLRIKALKEGTVVPLRVPVMTVLNTDSNCFWLTNFIETMMSAENWIPCTSATIALQYLKLLTKYAKLSGGDLGFIPFQAHDFSMRGMSIESGMLSGAGHLLSFVGSDTISATYFHEKFYNANIEKELVGTSVNATEHSVMCAGGKENEFATYERLITKTHPTGILSIVSDTWDLWHVLTVIIATLKQVIMARDGKVVIRPDSGDPVKILCGDPASTNENERKGVIQILWEIFGGTVTDEGFKVLDPHIGAIYGDSITLARADAICKGLIANGFASTNIVFGIGSFTYQYNTRDTFGFAMKATHVVINGEEHAIQKDPVTDKNRIKKSASGRLIVTREYPTNAIVLVDGLTIEQQEEMSGIDLLETVFLDGVLVRDEKLSDIRARVQSHI